MKRSRTQFEQGTRARRRAVFLDRDGVINALVYHKDASVVDSPFMPSQFRVLPRVPEAIRLMNKLGLVVVVVSNQPGIAKKHFGAATLTEFERKLKASLRAAAATIDAVYYCLHHPEAQIKSLRRRCACRKPGIGMLVRAARELGLSLAESYMVGDGLTDIEAGSRAECRTIFIGRWKCEYCEFIHPPTLRPTYVAKNLWEAAQLIKSDLHAEHGAVSQAVIRSQAGGVGL